MMAKQKILVWHWGRRGGGPRYTFELARALIEGGEADVHLSLSRQSEIFCECATLAAPGFHVDTYKGIAEALLASLRLPFIRQRFWRYVREQQFDVIVCTMSHVWNVPVLAGRRDKTPYIMVLHDALPHPGDDVPLRHWLLKREIGYTNAIIALTDYVRSILCNTYDYPKRLTRVVPHGVFAYAKTAAAPVAGTVRLLFFGRILPYKGLDILLEAYAILRAENYNISLTVSGAGDLSPYAHQLQDVTIDNRWIGEDEIGAIFEQADICVAPYREASQSGVVATAYAAGVPMVVTPTGGLVEQVKHEQTGLICDAANAASLATALKRMLDEPGLRARCAEGALREAKEELAWPAIGKRFTQAVQELLREVR